MEKKITILTKEAIDWMTSNHYSLGRIKVYEALWRRHLMPFMESHNLSAYSPDVGALFVKQMLVTVSADGLKHNHLEYQRCVDILNDILQYSEVRNHRKKTLPPFYGSIGKEMQEFLDFLRSERRSLLTVECHHRYLLYFLNYLTDNGISDLNSITHGMILDYFSTDMPSKKHSHRSLRYFFKYLFNFGKVDGSILTAFDMIKIPEKEKMISVYSEQEIAKIVNSVKHCDPSGKRNYAMLLLAVFYGLRASDIADLRLDYINLENNSLDFTMVKTGKFISLPLRTEVRAALADYLAHSRPNKVKSPNIFLSLTAPHRPITNKGVTIALRNVIARSGVVTSGRHCGAHIFRHSLASAMLQNRESYPIISEALGHVYKPTTMKYLRIDIAGLLKCSLEVPEVAPEFYEQKGGVFYES